MLGRVSAVAGRGILARSSASAAIDCARDALAKNLEMAAAAKTTVLQKPHGGDGHPEMRSISRGARPPRPRANRITSPSPSSSADLPRFRTKLFLCRTNE